MKQAFVCAKLSVALAFAALPVLALSQSTVADLMDKGGSALTKAQWQELLPLRIEFQWPNRQGEEELFLSADGKITGKGYHYSSRSESPASGAWRVEDDGKVCTPKTFTAWNSSTNLCWYFFQQGGSYFAAPKLEPDAKVGKLKSMAKVPGG